MRGRRRLFLAADTTRSVGRRAAARARAAEELLAVAASFRRRREHSHCGIDARGWGHPRVDPRGEGGRISWGYFYTDEVRNLWTGIVQLRSFPGGEVRHSGLGAAARHEPNLANALRCPYR